jgi:GNAT superfamily N-acetyltransferase
MIREFAEYERELELVSIIEDDLLRDGSGPAPKFRVLIAEWEGQTAGFALFFGFYSIWVGKPGLFLGDLFVRQQYRGRGIGQALLARVARIARDEGCYGVRWEVLNWNTPAIEFYRSFGAKMQNE